MKGERKNTSLFFYHRVIFSYFMLEFIRNKQTAECGGLLKLGGDIVVYVWSQIAHISTLCLCEDACTKIHADILSESRFINYI